MGWDNREQGALKIQYFCLGKSEEQQKNKETKKRGNYLMSIETESIFPWLTHLNI